MRIPGVVLAVLVTVPVTAVGAACSASRDDPLSRVTAPPAADDSVFVPGTLDATATPYVDGLAANFAEGVRLRAKLDLAPSRCVAERWIAVFDPVALEQGGITPEAMAEVTFAELTAAVDLDRPRATALMDSFAPCAARYESAFLSSLVATGDVSTPQRVCLAQALPDGLLETITVDVLAGGADGLDPTVDEQFAAALDACPA